MPNPVAGTTASLQWTLMDQSGNALDLTGAAVTLVLVSPSAARATYPATITTPTAGVVTVTLVPSAIPTAGVYQLQWQITFGDGTVGATDPIQILTVDRAL